MLFSRPPTNTTSKILFALHMASNSASNGDTDELDQILRTPERIDLEVHFYRDEEETPRTDLDDETSEESNPQSTVETILDNIPYDPSEWQVVDLSNGKSRHPRQHEFLKLLLQNSRYASYVSWIDQGKGLFQIHQPEAVAKLWQKVKNRTTEKQMDYSTFARGIRHYYKDQKMIKTNRKYTFQFNLSKMDF